jgi:hypothetical protein
VVDRERARARLEPRHLAAGRDRAAGGAQVRGVGAGDGAEVDDPRRRRVQAGDPGRVRLERADPSRVEPAQPDHPVRGAAPPQLFEAR